MFLYRSYNWPLIICFLLYPIFAGWLQYYMMGEASESDNKFSIGLAQILTLVALLFNLPGHITTLSHEVIAISIISMSCSTCRSYHDRHWADFSQLLLVTIIQVVMICHRLVKFWKSKANFSNSTRFKEIDRYT